MSEWQQIDTAPKDGTKIDLLYPGPRGRLIDAYWYGRLGIGWVRREPVWHHGELLPEDDWDIHSYPNMEPTHWMPSPSPPGKDRGET